MGAGHGWRSGSTRICFPTGLLPKHSASAPGLIASLVRAVKRLFA